MGNYFVRLYFECIGIKSLTLLALQGSYFFVLLWSVYGRRYPGWNAQTKALMWSNDSNSGRTILRCVSFAVVLFIALHTCSVHVQATCCSVYKYVGCAALFRSVDLQ